MGVARDVEDAEVCAGGAERLAIILMLFLIILVLFPCVLDFIILLSFALHLQSDGEFKCILSC